MPVYKNLSDFKGNTLWVVSSDWFNPTYSLTDGENEYGKIYHEGAFSSTTIFETNNLIIAACGAANGDITLKSADGKMIGYAGTALFKGGLCLTFNNGITANLSQPDKWSPNWSWTGTEGNCMMTIEGNIQLSLIFSCDQPFSGLANFPLLLFSAIKYLIYLHTNAS